MGVADEKLIITSCDDDYGGMSWDSININSYLLSFLVSLSVNLSMVRLTDTMCLQSSKSQEFLDQGVGPAGIIANIQPVIHLEA